MVITNSPLGSKQPVDSYEDELLTDISRLTFKKTRSDFAGICQLAETCGHFGVQRILNSGVGD